MNGHAHVTGRRTHAIPLTIAASTSSAMRGRCSTTKPEARHRRSATEGPENFGRRGGWSLIECLVVMAAAAMLLPIATTTMIHLITLQRAVEEEGLLIQASLDLSQSFHADWQLSTQAELLAEEGNPALRPRGLRLQLPDETAVEYSLEDAMIVRTTMRQGQIAGRDGFRVPPRTKVVFAVDKLANRSVGSVLIAPARFLKSDRAGRELRVTAIRPKIASAKGNDE